MSDTSSELTVFDRTYTPVEIFVPGAFGPMLEYIKAEIAKEDLDATSAPGRRKIISLAMKVTKTKTSIDAAGKELVAGEKRRLAKIDEERRNIWDALEGLAADVRKPVTEFEKADEGRVNRHKGGIAHLNNLLTFLTPPTMVEIETRLKSATDIDPDSFEEFAADAAGARALAIAHLSPMLDVARRAESERAELELLRAAEAERKRRERDEAVAAEATRAAEALAAAEIRRAEQERIDAEARAVKAERERADAVRAAEENARRREEVAAATERQRIADENAAAETERKRRESDQAHKGAVNTAALNALIAAGIPADVAKAVIVAIALGKIPAVTISY